MKYDKNLEERLKTATRQAIERVLRGEDIGGDERAHVICVCPDCVKAVGKSPTTPEDWSIHMNGDATITCVAPIEGPGGMTIAGTSKALSERLLFALCNALLKGDEERDKEVEEAVKQAIDTLAANHVTHPSILNAVMGLFNEMDGGWTPDARDHLTRLRTLLGMHGAPFIAKQIEAATEALDHSPDGLVSATPLKKAAPKEELYYILDHINGGGLCVWWMPNSNGYTYNIHEAGKYTKEQCTICTTISLAIPYMCSEIDVNGEGHGRGRVEVRNLPRPTEIQRKEFWKEV
jgi:hypothetical protein